MRVHNLLLLFYLPTRHTKGKDPLIDYFKSHVVTSFEYLDILRKKTMEKVDIEEIKIGKKKDKEDKKAKQVVELGFAAERIAQKIVEKRDRTQFTTAWTPTIVAEVSDCYHHDFQACLPIDPCKYMGGESRLHNMGLVTIKDANMG